MNRFGFGWREIGYRRGRSLATAGSICLAIFATILLAALARAYSDAVRRPMQTVGADMIVQLNGSVPRKLEGLVFPHPNAPLPRDAVERIGNLHGVLGSTRAVYFWILAPQHFNSVLGVQDGDAGLASLAGKLTAGNPIAADDRDKALADSDYAAKEGLQPGSRVSIQGREFSVAGIVDAAQSAKVFRADIYIPLHVAQELAAAAPQVKALYPFQVGDCNVLLVKVDRSSLEPVVRMTKEILGDRAVVSSELSFQETIASALFLSERLSLILTTVVALFAAAFVLRATATSVNERRRDMAVLQAVGWRWRSVGSQVMLENVILALVGCFLGVLLAAIAMWGIGAIHVTVDLPWDLSATPHFLPNAMAGRQQTVSVPLSLSPVMVLATWLGGLAVASLAAIFTIIALRPTPWPLLRGE